MRDRIREYLSTGIYGITCEALAPGGDSLASVRQMINAGIRVIQYREKEKNKRDKLAECKAIRELCKPAGALFIVNDDVDIAILCGAGGVHVGQDDLPADQVRKLTGPEMVIGVSCETEEQVADAVARGADYVGVGPVFATQTKRDAGRPIGLDLLELIARKYPLPVVAIGGIDEENIVEVYRRGVPCVAMISALLGCGDIPGKVAAIRRRVAQSGC